MSNISFRFKRISDQTEVSADEVDRQVCLAFGLTYGNLNDSGHPDYGHFPLDPSTYGQDYISWYGFISVILWWGDVPSGSHSMSDLLGDYVFDVWDEAIAWPEDSIILAARLFKFLHKQGLYLDVSRF